MNVQQAIELMGSEPFNEIGQCFDSAIQQIVYAEDTPDDARLVHAIGTANMPGQEGSKIGHAWIEFNHSSGIRVALDTTWGKVIKADRYRQILQVEYAVEYSLQQTLELWREHLYAGPWDDKIIQVVKEGQNERTN